MVVRDQLHRTISFTNQPKRIVSLVPSQTELLVDLGLKRNLVGVTKFCVHPVELRSQTTVVGGTKQVNYRKVAATKPDIIVCNKEENTEEMVKSLEKIAPVWISDIYSISDSLSMIKALGEVFQVREKALEIVSEIISEERNFKNWIRGKQSLKVAYLIWKDPYMAAGGNTFINHLLEINGFRNVLAEDSRYPEVSQEQLNEVELLLLSSEPYPFKENDAKELRKMVSAEVKIVNGEYFSWYGSRLKLAFNYFKELHE